MEEICVPAEQVTYRKRSASSMIMGVLLGSLIGAGVALLSAPRTGMETRQLIRDKSVELKDRAVDTANDTRLRAEELVRKGTEKASELRDKGMSSLQSTVDGVKEGVRSLRSGSESTSAMNTTTVVEDLDTGTMMIIDSD